MSHLLIAPILLPLFIGALLLMSYRLPQSLKRWVSAMATWALVPLAISLLLLADDGQLRMYTLGNWQAPFGITLVLDRLSAMMLLVTSILAGFAVIYACRGDDDKGPNFHALFQFQLLGINGAFLTGDLFNLFVFFEILLIASYSLLLHGNTAGRVKAGVHYVVLNLLGSSLFLIGVAILYGLLGSLNMIDLGRLLASAGPEITPLLAAAGYLLLMVFGLKAAMLPLYFWLPSTYASASAPVAALFAIMTKIGLYAIIRVFTLIYGDNAGELANMAQDLLWWLALLTIIAGGIGALAARRLQILLGYLVVVSVGTLLAGYAIGTPKALSATLYYLLHSTMIAGALFLLAGLIVKQRGDDGTLARGVSLRQPLLLGGLFFIAAISVAGLPPFSGFLGKVMLLTSVETNSDAAWLWSCILIAGLAMVVSLSRAGSNLFWRTSADGDIAESNADGWCLFAVIGLLLISPVLVIAANPVVNYVQATASQLFDLAPYLQLISGGQA